MLKWHQKCFEKIKNNASVDEVSTFLKDGNYDLNKVDANGMTLLMHLVSVKAYNSYTKTILESTKSSDTSLRKYVNLNITNKNGHDTLFLATAAENAEIEPLLNQEKIRKKRLETMYETHKDDPTIPKIGYHETSPTAYEFIENDRKKEKYPMIGGGGGYFGGGIYFAATKEESSNKALHHGYGLECPLRMGNIYRIRSLAEKEQFYKTYFDENPYDTPTDVVRERLLTYKGESYDSVWGHYDNTLKKIEDRILPTGDEYVVYSTDQVYVKDTFIVVQNHWLSKSLKNPRIYDPYHTPESYQPGDVYLEHQEETYFRIQFAYKDTNDTIQLTKKRTVGDDSIKIPYDVCKDVPNSLNHFKPLLPIVDTICPMVTDTLFDTLFKEDGKSPDTLVSVLRRFDICIKITEASIVFKYKKLPHKLSYPIVQKKETFGFVEKPNDIFKQLSSTTWVITHNAKQLEDIRLVAVASDKENRLSLLSPNVLPTMKTTYHFLIERFKNEPLDMYAQCLEWLAFFKDATQRHIFKAFRERLKEYLTKKPSSKLYAFKPHYKAMMETLQTIPDSILRTEEYVKKTPLDIYDVMYRPSNFTSGIIIQNTTDAVEWFIVEDKNIKDTNGYYKSLSEPLGDTIVNAFNRQSPYPPPTVLKGHKASVTCVAFHPDGTLLATGSEDRTIQLWNTNDHTCIATLEGHTTWVNRIAFSPDGTLLVSGSSDLTVKVWRLSDNSCIATLEGHTQAITCIAFHPKNNIVASSSFDSTICIWDITTNKLKQSLSINAQAYSVVFSPDGQRMLVGTTSRSIQLWNTEDIHQIKFIKSLERHTDYVTALAFSPKGDLFASGSADTTIRIWRMRDYTCEAILKGHPERVNDLAFHSKGNIVAATDSSKKTVWLWRLRDFKHIATLQTQEGSAVYVAFHPNGTMLASGSAKKNAHLWDISTPEDIPVTIPGLTLTPPTTHMEPIMVKHDNQVLMHLYPWNRLEGRNPNFGKEAFFVRDRTHQILVKVKGTDVQFNLSVYFDHLETERPMSGGRGTVYQRTDETRRLLGRERVIYTYNRKKYIKTKGVYVPIASLR